MHSKGGKEGEGKKGIFAFCRLGKPKVPDESFVTPTRWGWGRRRRRGVVES